MIHACEEGRPRHRRISKHRMGGGRVMREEGTEVMLPAPDGEGLSGGMIDGVLFAGSAPVACVSSFRGVE